MKLCFERREELASAIWQYHFRPERPLDFVAGQYASFRLPQALSDQRGQARTFTLTSLPGDELVSFVAKFVSPLSPYKQTLQALRLGDELRLDDPMGDLVLPKKPDLPLVFVAGGIGIASYVGMLELLTRQKEERRIFLFYAMRSRREQIFRQLTQAYPLELKQLIFAPNHLDVREIITSTPPEAQIYISGSQKFVEGLQTGLAASGVPHEQIVFDYFDGYADL